MTAIAVVGSQWGDEGKGKITDFLSKDAAMAVRSNGGNNAGHTIEIGDKTFKMRLIPSGIFAAKKGAVIGNGVVINPEVMFGELDNLEKEGIDKINKLADDMGLADVMLPDYNKIVNTGNLMRYSSSSVPTYRERLDDQNNSIVYSDSDVLEKEKELTASYYSLFSYLEKRNTMTYTDSLVKTIVRFDDEYINGIEKAGGYVSPLYMYDHSGISLSTGGFFL